MSADRSAPLKRPRAGLLIWLGIIVLIGAVTASQRAAEVDRQMRADLLAETQRIADTLNPHRLAALTGTEADADLPEYQRLKSQFQSVRQAFPNYRFIYLMVRRPDQTVIIQVDSEPPGSEDESPPGDVYHEIAPEELQVFDPGIALTTRPTEDRWGVWVSALVPIPGSTDFPGQVALGVDIDARDWRGEVMLRGVAPVALATLGLLMIVGVGQRLFARRAQAGPAGCPGLRLLEPYLVLAVGLVLTVVATWMAYDQGQRDQRRAFELMADAPAQEIRTSLRNLRDFGLEGLVRFFEASEFVTEQDFAHYTALLAREAPAIHWAWAAKIPVDEREAFEQQVRAEGISDFRIWGPDDDPEEPRGRDDRDVLYPVSRITDRLPGLSLLGFDLASLPSVHPTLEAVLQAGLVSAVTILDGTYAPPLRGHMLVVQPTSMQFQDSPQEGVAVTTISFADIVADLALNDMLTVELLLLNEDGSRLALDQTGVRDSAGASALSLETPLLLFGRTFLIRVLPGSGFEPAHRNLVGSGTALSGSLLTLMLALVVGLVARRRKGLEQAVRERTIALQEFRAAVEQSNEGIALTDLDGTVRFVNQAWAEMHGYRPGEVSGKHLSLFHTADQMEREVEPSIAELLENGSAVAEIGHLHRDGHRFPTRMSASLIRNEQGEPYGILGLARNVSEELQQLERERFEQRFRELVAEIAASFVSAPDDAGFDHSLEHALASLGGLFEVDRTSLFRVSGDRASTSMTHEWCAGGIEHQKDQLQSVPLDGFNWWMRQWSQRQAIVIEDADHMPSEASAEQALVRARNIRSMACLPMFDENARLLGFLGFDSVRSLRNWPGQEVEMLQAVADILAGALRRRQVVQALAESESSYRELAEESRSFRWQVDMNGLYTDLDSMVEKVLGYQPEELVGKKYFYDLAPESDREEIKRDGLKLLRARSRFNNYENRMLDKDGQVHWVSSTILPVFDEQGHQVGISGSDTDITERKQAELQLEHLAHHDLLTGLPNRVLLADRLQQAMAQTDRRRDLLGVAALDLDAFKPINDRFGHDVGDRLLVTVARRMQETLREGDTVARLGGDEFALILVGLASVEACQPLLQRLLESVAEPIEHEGHSLQVSISLGVSFYPQDDIIDADQLLRQADQAMYQAKVAGRNRYHLFDAEHDRRLRASHQQIERVRKALEEEEFLLHYQPKVDMKEGRVVGMEALLRWQHPEEGLLPPAAFLPLLQQHKLMIRLGDWVIESVLDRITSWRADGLALPVSLNIDPLQLNEADFIAKLADALQRHPAVQPNDLELEVLETSALDDAVSMAEIITAAGQLGVAFSLDDFGTGYSSLAYLKRLPAATLKIDRSFVRDMLHDPDDLAILQGIISLARTFRQTVIAEGVETEAHGEMLLQVGCQLGQGYAIARPMPAEDVPAWLEHWRPPQSWLATEPVDDERLHMLIATVEYRNWHDRLQRLTESKENGPPISPHPAPEFAAWLASHASESENIAHCQSLQSELERLAAEVIDHSQSGQSKRAGEVFARLDGVLDELIATLRSEINGSG